MYISGYTIIGIIPLIQFEMINETMYYGNFEITIFQITIQKWCIFYIKYRANMMYQSRNVF